MYKKHMNWAMLFPFLSVLVIVGFGGGLGVVFILLNELVEEWAVVVLGMSLVVGVPGVAALLDRRLEAE